MIVPASVLRIGKNSFTNCSNLEKIKFESFSTRIESNSFDGCPKLTSCSFPSCDLDYNELSSSYKCNVSSYNEYDGEIQCKIFNFIKILLNHPKDYYSHSYESPFEHYITKIVDILSYISSNLSESIKNTSNLSYIKIFSRSNLRPQSCDINIHIDHRVISFLFTKIKSIPQEFNHSIVVLEIKRSSQYSQAFKITMSHKYRVNYID